MYVYEKKNKTKLLTLIKILARGMIQTLRTLVSGKVFYKASHIFVGKVMN